MSGIFVGTPAFVGTSVQLDDGTNPAETWTYDSRLGYPVATLHQVIADLVAWINDAGRAWTGVITAASAVLVTHDPQLDIELAFTGGAFTISPAGGFTAATGLPSTGAVSTWTPGVMGSMSPLNAVVAEVRLTDWHGVSGEPGSVCASGSWAMDGGATTSDAKRPHASIELTEAQAAGFVTALRNSRSPRVATIYDPISEAWRLVAVGSVDQRQDGFLHQRVTLAVVG